MPWKAFRHDNEWCVFKLNADDEATGDSLGCHDTRAEANAQVAALNINVEEQGQMNDTMLESTTLEIDGEQPVTLATLIDTYKEAHRHEWGGEGPSVEMMPDGAWSARSFADLAAARVAEYSTTSCVTLR
jgi:hypothetical protein